MSRRGVRIRTNLSVGLLDELLKFPLRKRLVFHVHPDRKAKTTSFARADRNSTRHLCLACVLLVLLTDEIESAAKASGIASGEQMLRCGCSEFAGPTHFLRH